MNTIKLTSRASALAVAFAVLFSGSLASAQSGGQAYVDIQRAITGVDDGQRAMTRLQGQLEERQNALDATETELRELTTRLETEINEMDEAARAEALQAYQAAVMQYQEQYVENQQALMEMEAEATREIVERMVGIVGEIAAEQGVSMVFERTRSSIVWAADGLDLTDELIRRYEEAH